MRASVALAEKAGYTLRFGRVEQVFGPPRVGWEAWRTASDPRYACQLATHGATGDVLRLIDGICASMKDAIRRGGVAP